MERLIETLILYTLLVIFAIYGITVLAPKVAQVLSTHLEKAAHAGER